MTKIDRAWSNAADVRDLLRRHSRVAQTESGDDVLGWIQSSWHRTLRVGDTTVSDYGLVELMDNNPLVCADVASVPSPGVTLGLIALGPLADAGILADSPTLVLNTEVDTNELEQALARLGWAEGAIVHSEPVSTGTVLAATAMAVITTDSSEDVQAIYDERFGRSFFVRNDQTSVWDVDLVAGQPFAVYRLSLAPEQPNSLVTLRVIADRNGKAGAGQLIHAMNVMCGFEESLAVSLSV